MDTVSVIRFRWSLAAVIAALAQGACAEGHTLIVGVRADLTPGVEVTEFSVDVQRADGAAVGAQTRGPIRAGDDLFEGVRVRELTGVPTGTYHVRVTVTGPGGFELANTATADVRGTRAVTVVITRSCRGVSCPMAEAPLATACREGVCIDPRCTPETPELCLEGCRADDQCPAPSVPCGVTTCADRICFESLDDGRCAAGERCHPERGCERTHPSADAGVVDGGAECGDGTCDAGGGVDAGGCVPGVECTPPPPMDCFTGLTTCDPAGCARRGLQPAGTPCASGLCDALGSCIAQGRVTVSVIGDGIAETESGAISCAPTCTALYPVGDAVDLIARPSPGGAFVGWSGACSSRIPFCRITVAAGDNDATVEFESSGLAVTAIVSGSGTGTVQSAPLGITCPSTCTDTFSLSPVVLTATADAGSVFDHWVGCPSVAENRCTLVTSATVTAVFEPESFTLTASIPPDPFASGTITSSPAGISCPGDCAEAYPSLTAVRLTADPPPGVFFLRWSGACSRAPNPCDLVMTSDLDTSAFFARCRARICGDVNGDGRVDTLDISLLDDHIAGTSPLDDCAFWRADVAPAHDAVNSLDRGLLSSVVGGALPASALSCQ